MKKLNDFLLGILGGGAISIGVTAFLSAQSKPVGALLFSVGLFMVCVMGLNLYTGKVCYLPGQPVSYLGFLSIVWVGNLIGAQLTAMAVRATRLAPPLIEKAEELAAAKSGDGLLSLFLLAVLCNVLIFMAVDGYRTNPHQLGKYLGILFGVSVFVLCGFEHCVADMYYFALAEAWSGETFLRLLVITAGNSVGGLLLPVCFLVRQRSGKAQA